MARPLDDLGPNFDQRWKKSPRTRRRELIAELRDLYLMLEEEDLPLLARVPGLKAAGLLSEVAPSLEAMTAEAAPVLQGKAGGAAATQGSLFTDPPAPKENPFLPRSVLARLQQAQSQANAGLRDLMQNGEKRPGGSDGAPEAARSATPPTHEQVDLERELRLRLGPLIETLIEAQVDTLKSELRVRLRAEMDRLIAEHVRK